MTLMYIPLLYTIIARCTHVLTKTHEGLHLDFQCRRAAITIQLNRQLECLRKLADSALSPARRNKDAKYLATLVIQNPCLGQRPKRWTESTRLPLVGAVAT